MKTKTTCMIMMLTASLILTRMQVNAQTWNLAGNTNATATSRLGTNNNIPLSLFTNNAEQVHINANTAGKVGFVGLGTTAPNTRLHVNGVVTATGGTSTNWNTAYTRVASTYTNNRIPRWNGTAFVNGTIFDNGTNVGVGITSAPPARLSVANTTINGIASPGAFQIGLSNNYNLVMDQNQIQARNNGAGSLLYLNYWAGDVSIASAGTYTYVGGNLNGYGSTNYFAGSVGMGSSPGSFKLKVSHGSYGFNLESASTGNDWEFLASPSLYLIFNGAVRGVFNGTSGAYTATSDERLKTNIKPMGTMLDKINQLKPSVYQFKNTDDKQEYNGFIAQEVMHLFPSLVTHNVVPDRNFDVYTMDYSGFGVIAIKGIQELNEKLMTENEVLKSRLDQLEGAMSECCTYHTSGKNTVNQSGMAVDQSRLEQNTPNPFNKSTVIKYYVPENFSSAQLKIYSAQGVEIKSFSIKQSGKGEITVESNSLVAGIYTYTLIVDENAVDVKQMIVTK